uniref:Uncharacterized protein n=1 Tax=Anguilla anguilla TaxID=7936 RepID=A0A0E9XZ27_ANGAN
MHVNFRCMLRSQKAPNKVVDKLRKQRLLNLAQSNCRKSLISSKTSLWLLAEIKLKDLPPIHHAVSASWKPYSSQSCIHDNLIHGKFLFGKPKNGKHNTQKKILLVGSSSSTQE